MENGLDYYAQTFKNNNKQQTKKKKSVKKDLSDILQPKKTIAKEESDEEVVASIKNFIAPIKTLNPLNNSTSVTELKKINSTLENMHEDITNALQEIISLLKEKN